MSTRHILLGVIAEKDGTLVIDCYAGLVIMADKDDKGRAL